MIEFLTCPVHGLPALVFALWGHLPQLAALEVPWKGQKERIEMDRTKHVAGVGLIACFFLVITVVVAGFTAPASAATGVELQFSTDPVEFVEYLGPEAPGPTPVTIYFNHVDEAGRYTITSGGGFDSHTWLLEANGQDEVRTYYPPSWGRQDLKVTSPSGVLLASATHAWYRVTVDVRVRPRVFNPDKDSTTIVACILVEGAPGSSRYVATRVQNQDGIVRHFTSVKIPSGSCRTVGVWDGTDDYGFQPTTSRFHVVAEARFLVRDTYASFTDSARVRFGITSSEPTPASTVDVVGVCPEDAVIVGQGDYTGGVGWDRYVCVARDDL